MTEQKRSRKEIDTDIIVQAWRDEAYKQELLSNPKAVIAREIGVEKMPDQLNVQVLQETPTSLYFVLPMSPSLSGAELTEEQLEAVAGGDPFQFVSDVYENVKDFGSEVYKAIF